MGQGSGDPYANDSKHRWETEVQERELSTVMGELGAELRVGIRSAEGFNPLGDGRRGKERSSQTGTCEQRWAGGLEQKMHPMGQSGPEWELDSTFYHLQGAALGLTNSAHIGLRLPDFLELPWASTILTFSAFSALRCYHREWGVCVHLWAMGVH